MTSSSRSGSSCRARAIAAAVITAPLPRRRQRWKRHGAGTWQLEIEQIGAERWRGGGGCPARPRGKRVVIVQDRLRQRTWLDAHIVFPLGPCRPVATATRRNRAIATMGRSCSEAGGGYDGRGSACREPYGSGGSTVGALCSGPVLPKHFLDLELELSVPWRGREETVRWSTTPRDQSP